MMEDFNQKIDDLLKYLDVEKIYTDKSGEQYITSDGAKTRLDTIEKIRQILGIDEMCVNCCKYKFKYDLVLVEGIGKKICQDCAEGLISGDLKINEQI